MEPRALVQYTKGKTMLIETNLNTSSISVPKMLSWDNITRNLKWVLKITFIPQKKEEKK